MPEPPFQTDMRSQDLPPRPAREHSVAVDVPLSLSIALFVTRPDELPAALEQHEKPVVIENTPDNAWLIRAFKWFLRWRVKREKTYQLLIIGAVVVWVSTMFNWFTTFVITNGYNLDANWHVNWKVGEADGKITLTPPPSLPVAPRPAPGGEE